MGLIIKDKIQMLKVGYPTVSDKYDVAGGILGGSTAVKFGDLVKRGTTTGYYEPATGVSDITEVCGFVLATNVKLAQEWPGETVQVNPGEPFNLLIRGFIAIELDDDATIAQIVANNGMGLILATGKITTADKIDNTDVIALPNCVFTGINEAHGTKKIAEIYVK